MVYLLHFYSTKIYLSIGVIVTIAFLIGISFALWNVNIAQEGINSITSGCLKLTLTDESDAINLRNTYPITDEDAKKLKPYNFKIENTCNNEVSYNLSLEMMEVENRLNSEYIAISIDNGTKSILSSLEKTEVTYNKGDYTPVEGRMLVNGILKGNESKSHSIRLWMDEGTPAIEETMNKTFIGKVVLNATLTGRYVEEILNGAEPVLADNLIPVEIDDSGKVTKANLKSEWYSYEKKMWANAVILEDETITYNDGEEIPESNIESYFVWIPKYSYQLWDLGNYTGVTTIDTSKVHEIPIKFGLENTSDDNDGECTTPMTSGASGNCKIGDYMTPPAFITMETNGLWVGKFETGYKGATSTAAAQVNSSDSTKIQIKPNVYSWRNINVGNAFNAGFNYKRELNSHMMKNTEWGAVAYLQHSVYGSSESVRINNNSAFITGYAGVEEPNLGYNTNGASIEGNRNESTSLGVDGTYTKNYLNPSSVVASTTGNYSGIYDMSGGSWEYVMGVRDSITSGSAGITNTSIESKYYDLYGTSSSYTDYQYRILGDGTTEFGPFQNFKDPDNAARHKSSWYYDYAIFINSSYPWLYRSGSWNHGVTSGVFAFGDCIGENHIYISYRLVLAI